MPNIKALGIVNSDKKNTSCFPYIRLWKTYEPQGGAIFGPGASFEQT